MENIFDKLTFNSEKEKCEFESYLPQRGVYLFKQIYDILLEDRSSVSYSELSSTIRYDKALRYKLYEYLALFEENLRNQLLLSYDVASACGGLYKQHANSLDTDLQVKIDRDHSNLFYRLEIDFGKLMDICVGKGLVTISSGDRKRLKELRNCTMHHYLLLFGHSHNNAEAIEHCHKLERQLNTLYACLPLQYQDGFITAINHLNGTKKRWLKRFYLEGTKDGICFKA